MIVKKSAADGLIDSSKCSTITGICIWLPNICMFPYMGRHLNRCFSHVAHSWFGRCRCLARFQEHLWIDNLYCYIAAGYIASYGTNLGPACHSSRTLCWFLFRFGMLFLSCALHKRQVTVASLKKIKENVREESKLSTVVSFLRN